MVPDAASVILRALSFIAALQAVGGALFLAIFGRFLSAAVQPVVSLTRKAAFAGIALLAAHTWLEAGRMAGTLSGMIDPELLELVFHSPAMRLLGVRVPGLLLALIAVRRRNACHAVAAVFGAALFAASFAMTGHTADHVERWLLAPALTIHLLIVTFWFGALLPLYIVSRTEGAAVSARVVERFSVLAVWVVPVILVAGLLLLQRLVPGVSALFTPYGLLMLGKIAGFSILMGLAALNKWRLGPALAAGADALPIFRLSVLIEFILLCLVLTVTACLTTFYSPVA